MAWVADLEQRLAYYIIENEGKILPATEAIIPAKNTRVEVRPVLKGDIEGWSVTVDGKAIAYFYGENAQRRASFRANQILNDGV